MQPFLRASACGCPPPPPPVPPTVMMRWYSNPSVVCGARKQSRKILPLCTQSQHLQTTVDIVDSVVIVTFSTVTSYGVITQVKVWEPWDPYGAGKEWWYGDCDSDVYSDWWWSIIVWKPCDPCGTGKDVAVVWWHIVTSGWWRGVWWEVWWEGDRRWENSPTQRPSNSPNQCIQPHTLHNGQVFNAAQDTPQEISLIWFPQFSQLTKYSHEELLKSWLLVLRLMKPVGANCECGPWYDTYQRSYCWT